MQKTIFSGLLFVSLFVGIFAFIGNVYVAQAQSGTGCAYTSGSTSFEGGECHPESDITSSACLSAGRSSNCKSDEICCGASLKVDVTVDAEDESGDTSTATSDDFCASGLVPCGRNCDNPNTDIREDQMCTLCHLFRGFQNIINWGMMLLTFVALAALTAAGILYLVSGGNQSMVENAKQFMKNALFGFFLVLVAWVIINTVILLIGGKLENVEKSDTSWWKISCSYDRDTTTNTTTNTTNTNTNTTNNGSNGSTTGGGF